MLQTNLADASYSLWSLVESGAIAQSLLGWSRANSPQTPVDRKIHAFARYVSGLTRRRLISLMIQLVAIVPLMTASRTLADPPVRLLLHTNQGDLVRHLNQDGGWQQMLSEPQPVLLQSTPMDPFAVDLRDLLPDPWSHGNSPRMTTLPVRNIPAPGAVFVLGLAG